MTTETKIKETCECGTKYTSGYGGQHRVGPKHKVWAEEKEREAARLAAVASGGNMPPEFKRPDENEEDFTQEPLHHTIRAVIESPDSPIIKARAMRQTFAALGRPNREYPDTVRDILLRYGVPIHDTVRGSSMADEHIRRNNWEREIANG